MASVSVLYKRRYGDVRTAVNNVVVSCILNKFNKESFRQYVSLLDWTSVLNFPVFPDPLEPILANLFRKAHVCIGKNGLLSASLTATSHSEDDAQTEHSESDENEATTMGRASSIVASGEK